MAAAYATVQHCMIPHQHTVLPTLTIIFLREDGYIVDTFTVSDGTLYSTIKVWMKLPTDINLWLAHNKPVN